MKFLVLFLLALSINASMMAPNQRMQDPRCMVPASALAASSMPAGLCNQNQQIPTVTPIYGGASCLAMTPQCLGQTRSNYDCIHCNQLNNPRILPNQFNPQTSWYHRYAQMRWPQYNRPAVWNNGYADHNFYPGSGNVAVGKPNVYIHGNLIGKQRLQVKMKNRSHLLAASPIHGTDGWVFEKSGEILSVTGASYNYFYYDYKAHENYLQNKSGFCGKKDYLYDRMISILKEMSFKEREIKDFEDYWSVKYPGGSFCVYPQTHAELQKLAQWNGSFMPSSFRRVVFVSVPKKEGHKIISSHFKNEPSEDWNPQKGIYRVPASKNDISIHEWGVAFLTDKK